ncbi:MAG: MBOAT family protein [Candidatus Aminicenantes bacterium]|nr:MBOAT family protein [Candidatus Aminicenantes bacterium]
MIFTSFDFFLFFGILFFLHFSVPHKFRWTLLLAASYFFYGYYKLAFLPLLILPTLIIYFIAIKLNSADSKRTRKLLLIAGLAAGLSALFVFKYLDFLGESLKAAAGLFSKNLKFDPFDFILPIGISFYSFKLVSYLLDVYNDKLKTEKHLGYFALYTSFFPQLLAGPIDRAVNFIPELKKKVDFDYERVTGGFRLVLWGFFKKLVIADQLAVIVNNVYDNVTEYSGVPLIAATVAFSFQVYCDFSGYSDIAVGLSRILGFKSMNNFNSPYSSKSITKFWNNWHISLSTWLRDYLFLPIAYASVRKIKKPLLLKMKPETWAYVIGMFVTMFLGGLWHGAKWTFVLWGAVHGLFLIFSYTTKKSRKKIVKKIKLKRLPRFHKFLKVSVTFSLVTFAWIFFRANSISDAFYIISHLHVGLWDFFSKTVISFFFNFDIVPLRNLITRLGVTFFTFNKVGIAILIMELAQLVQRREDITGWFRKKPLFLRWCCYMLLLSLIVYWGKFDIKEFIYFRF